MSPKVDLFVFDIAGTTVRDDGVVQRAFVTTLERHGLTAPPEWIRARMGWNKVQVFREALAMHGRDGSSAAGMADQFTSCIIAEMDASPPAALAGAADSVRALLAAGVKVAFNTGYSTALAEEIIGRVGWRPDAIIGSDLVARGRPAPDMIQLAMTRTGVINAARVGVAGDTPSDLEAGAAAGCGVVIGVGHGTHTLEELRGSPHTHLLADLTTLPEVLHVAC